MNEETARQILGIDEQTLSKKAINKAIDEDMAQPHFKEYIKRAELTDPVELKRKLNIIMEGLVDLKLGKISYNDFTELLHENTVDITGDC